MHMNIWMIKISEPIAFDENTNPGRTGLLADQLQRQGHDVTWWISAFDHQRKRFVMDDDETRSLPNGVVVRAIRGNAYRKNFSVARYRDHARIAGRFTARAERAARTARPDAMVVSMPDHLLAYAAVRFAKRHDIPVLVDVRDPWPDVFFLHLPRALHPFARFLLTRDIRKVAWALHHADSVTSTVTDWLDWAQRYGTRIGDSRDAVFYIGSPRMPPPPTDAERTPALRTLARDLEGKFVALFVGTFNRNYDPSIIVEAAATIQHDHPDLANSIAFVIAGDGPEAPRTRHLAENVENVHLPGWADQRMMAAVMDLADVGIVPSRIPTEAFPNKAFTYFAGGLPVIASNDGDLQRLLTDEDVGLHYPREDLPALVDRILRLAGDPAMTRRMAERAQQLFEERFETEQVYTAFAAHVEAMADRNL